MTMPLTVTRFLMPPITLIGCGAAKGVGDNLKTLGAKKALIVTDKGLAKIGVADTIKQYIEQAGLQAVIYDGAEPNPTDQNVADGLKAYQQNGCDSIVSLGGGSSHDCGKGVGIVATNGGTIQDYKGIDTVTKPMPPFVALNTTAGTGSEMTPAAVITNTSNHVKMVVWSINVSPNVSINDPELMTGMPPALTAATGMDALTHAIEAYVAAFANPKSDALALQAIKLIAKYLQKAVANGQDIEARTGMAYAEYLAGEAFSSAGLGIAHSLAHQPGSFIGLPHGVCNAIFLPLVCEFNMIACVEKYADVAEAMGIDTTGMTERAAAVAAIEAIKTLSADIGIPAGLSELGMKEKDIPEMAEWAMKEVCTPTNPRVTRVQDMIELYKRAL
ncbi:iron-containing alcohol dehydrogenase [Geomonas sp. RF6]|uniref:iron-containing alcohol dehydrogenase n=1 Tax=Geomonas sp. RF6 TaxID=2897342 RepID=UPI001E38BDD6|nr:iron-containing alcohol dehydrogenase [Geomonas sp. RF6]UFS70778.1 iron-containing alcohol dehydrogenase [Geomonas sp. RF6]